MGEPAGLDRRWLLVAQVVLSVGLLVGLVYVVGGIEIPATVHIGWLAAALLLFPVAEIVATWAWAVYLGIGGSRPAWWSVFRANQASHVSSLMLPSPTPSLTRPVFLAEEAGAEEVLGSTVIERVNVLAVYGAALLLTTVVLWRWGQPELWFWIAGAGGVGLVGASIGLHVYLAGQEVSKRPPGWIRRALESLGGVAETSAGFVDGVLSTTGVMARDRQRVALGLGLQVLAIVLVHGILALCLGEALGLGAPGWAIFLVPTAANALAILPGLPRGLGAVEGAGTAMLVTAGVAAGPALTFLLAHRAVTIVGILVLGGPAVAKTGLGALWKLTVAEERTG